MLFRCFGCNCLMGDPLHDEARCVLERIAAGDRKRGDLCVEISNLKIELGEVRDELIREGRVVVGLRNEVLHWKSECEAWRTDSPKRSEAIVKANREAANSRDQASALSIAHMETKAELAHAKEQAAALEDELKRINKLYMGEISDHGKTKTALKAVVEAASEYTASMSLAKKLV